MTGEQTAVAMRTLAELMQQEPDVERCFVTCSAADETGSKKGCVVNSELHFSSAGSTPKSLTDAV